MKVKRWIIQPESEPFTTLISMILTGIHTGVSVTAAGDLEMVLDTAWDGAVFITHGIHPTVGAILIMVMVGVILIMAMVGVILIMAMDGVIPPMDGAILVMVMAVEAIMPITGIMENRTIPVNR